MSSLFKTMTLERMTVDQAAELLTLPRTVGIDPADGAEVVAQNGKYGPYVSKGKESRSIATEEQLLTITLDEALARWRSPGSSGPGRWCAGGRPLREFGTDPVSERPVIAKEGKFGVYVTDGETNASLRRGDRLEAMSNEQAHELLAIRREQLIEKGGAPGKKAAGTKKAAQEGPAETSGDEEGSRQEAHEANGCRRTAPAEV